MDQFKIECRKAFLNKYMAVSVGIGMVLAVLVFIVNTRNYIIFLHMLQETADRRRTYSDPSFQMYILYNNWILGEATSLGSTLFYFIMPLLAVIPYGWSLCEEHESNYEQTIIQKSGRKKYYFSKFIATYLSGGFAVCVPLVFSLALTATVFPAITPDVYYDTAYGVFGQSLFSELYYTVPLIYVVCYVLLDFIFCGFFACLGTISALMTHHLLPCILAPEIICLGFHYFRQFIYIVPDKIYKEVSPLFFLRGMECGYSADMKIILAELLGLICVCIFALRRCFRQEYL